MLVKVIQHLSYFPESSSITANSDNFVDNRKQDTTLKGIKILSDNKRGENYKCLHIRQICCARINSDFLDNLPLQIRRHIRKSIFSGQVYEYSSSTSTCFSSAERTVANTSARRTNPLTIF